MSNKLGEFILRDTDFEERAKEMGFSSGDVSEILLAAQRLNKNKKEPSGCPDCKSVNIAAREFEGEAFWRKVDCKNCGLTWVEYFKFHDWEYED